MKIIKDILEERTVNGNQRYSSTVNSDTTDNSLTVADKIEALLEREGIKPEGVGKILSEGLDDPTSERYYTLMATENPTGRLLEALSITKDASRRGVIKTKKAIYFQGILKRWGLKTKFKKGEDLNYS